MDVYISIHMIQICMYIYIYIYDSKPQTPYLCMILVCIYNIEKPCLRKPCLTKPVPIT